MKKGLNATQLKVIAVIAMTIDHIAWGFVDMFSVAGQVMHVIGRLTIPIMTFFIVEGYRKTSDIKKYVLRMTSFAVATIIPFYIFFGEEYKYRQNFIFDLTLALLVLYVTDNKTLKRPLKIIIVILLFAVSLLIGGWPVFPMVGALIFFYVKDYKRQAIVYSGAVVFLVGFMALTIWINNRYGYGIYDPNWVWYEWFYFLGFILALPLLGLYNGEKGTYPFGRYFFFIYYPAHFIVLYTVKLITKGNIRNVYMGLHILCMFLAFVFLVNLIRAKPSKAVTTAAILTISAMIYIFGFIMEVFTNSLSVMYSGTIIEYFGEILILISYLWFMSEFCQVKLPFLLYAVISVIGVIINYLVLTAPSNHIFYKTIGVNTSGPFPRIELEYGIGFYIFTIYSAFICLIVVFNCVRLMIYSEVKIVRKRAINMLIAMCCPWIAFAVKLSGLTGGYEISSVGSLGALYFVYTATIKYQFFDSVQLAGENAIHRYGGGLMVVDPAYTIKYMNLSMQELFPNIAMETNAKDFPMLWEIFQEKTNSLEVGNKIYEFEMTKLTQNDYLQGYMLTSMDMTEHYAQLEQVERLAQRDVLTGLYNRVRFSELYKEHRANGGCGSFLMIDLDDFKLINDTYGHEVGDKALICVANVLNECDNENCIAGRFGGDEYIMYIEDLTDKDELSHICKRIQTAFTEEINKIGCTINSSMSIGGVILKEKCTIDLTDDFENAYRRADNLLYESKKEGKAAYRLQ